MECRLPAACPALLLRASLPRFRHGAERLTRLGPAGNPEEGLELGGQHDVACQSNPAAEVCVHGVRVAGREPDKFRRLKRDRELGVALALAPSRATPPVIDLKFVGIGGASRTSSDAPPDRG